MMMNLINDWKIKMYLKKLNKKNDFRYDVELYSNSEKSIVVDDDDPVLKEKGLTTIKFTDNSYLIVNKSLNKKIVYYYSSYFSKISDGIYYNNESHKNR